MTELKTKIEAFNDYLKAEGMIPGGEHGAVSYNGKTVCYMHVEDGEEYPAPWTVWTEGDYSGEHKVFPLSEREKEITLASVNICGNCGCDCAPGSRRIIFGKEFDNVCVGAVMAFYKPEGETLELVKKLIEMQKLG
jgi:hypothetical protein